MKQYVGREKLYVLGYEKRGQRYVAETKVYDKKLRKMVKIVVGWIQLDKDGYLVRKGGQVSLSLR